MSRGLGDVYKRQAWPLLFVCVCECNRLWCFKLLFVPLILRGCKTRLETVYQSSGAVWKSRWPSWAPVPNKPTVSVDVKQHFNNLKLSSDWAWTVALTRWFQSTAVSVKTKTAALSGSAGWCHTCCFSCNCLVCVCVRYCQCVCQSSGAVWKSRWPSWAPRPNEPYGFCGRKATLNHAYTLVTVCP